MSSTTNTKQKLSKTLKHIFNHVLMFILPCFSCWAMCKQAILIPSLYRGFLNIPLNNLVANFLHSPNSLCFPSSDKLLTV